ncbi:hypothetical protein [Nonomuraea rhodomycinica]|uniref:Uncharacterized protein n=1 Tax=Nonomuraea rhodomycinica TaxID=1712872 RepID=A0A7Y6MGD1_9ACTN|nr:hypothetical protein [Nonomuraea rhodomycinica]NUW45769.1 hypothetical protein [Nonomuraea rhodomycinica]
MAADCRLALHATLPDRYAHDEVLASTIDHRGRLAALVADPSQGFTPVPHFSALRPPPRYDATAVICDGAEVREITLTDLGLWFTHIDTLGDGIVLAAARCEPVGVDIERYRWLVPEDELHLTDNVRVIDRDGQTQAAFYAGDGIEQLMTDAQGNIWTSYFDESNYWFANPDGTRSYRFMIGLARWDSHGSPPWMAPSHTPDVVWCDCYALNVGHEVVHACPYTDFPLIEIDGDGVRSITPNPVTRCSGLAVSGAELAFLDQHRAGGGFRWEIRRARREGGAVTETDRANLLLPDDRHPTGWARGKIGRDGTLWLHEDGDPRHWYRYELSS